MRLDEAREAELEELVTRLERLLPREDAHLTIPASPDGRTAVGNRLGYLRFGVEILRAALQPMPGSDAEPPRLFPQFDYLLTRGSETPFDFCEIDESVASRPPIASKLGFFGQLGAGVLIVGGVILLFIAAGILWHWVFG